MYWQTRENFQHLRWRPIPFQTITVVLSYFLGECVRFWSRQQRTLASLLGKQCFSWGFPADRCPWWGFWVQYNFDSCLHWKNKIFQGQMTLATGTSRGCNFQHAAEQSSVKMIWMPAGFESVNLWWIRSVLLLQCWPQGARPRTSFHAALDFLSTDSWELPISCGNRWHAESLLRLYDLVPELLMKDLPVAIRRNLGTGTAVCVSILSLSKAGNPWRKVKTSSGIWHPLG